MVSVISSVLRSLNLKYMTVQVTVLKHICFKKSKYMQSLTEKSYHVHIYRTIHR